MDILPSTDLVLPTAISALQCYEAPFYEKSSKGHPNFNEAIKIIFIYYPQLVADSSDDFIKYLGIGQFSHLNNLYETFGLNEIKDLKDNWDGYDAIAIPTEIIHQASAFLDSCQHQNITKHLELYPNPHGTVSFRWETPNGEANIEIGLSDFSFYYIKANCEPIMETGHVRDITKLISIIKSALFETEISFAATTKIRLQSDMPRYAY